MTKAVDVHLSGYEDPHAGLSLYCTDAKVGMGYSKHSDYERVLALLLATASARLGEPCVLGTLTKTGQAENAELDVLDLRRLINSPQAQALAKKKKGKRTTKPQWQPTEWGGGWDAEAMKG